VKRFAAAMILVTGIAAGCGGNKKPADTQPQAEITPVQPAVAAYTPTPAPAPVTTVTPEAPTATVVATAGGSYTVKKGDTLWKIAQSKYGDGRKWTQIAAANPGLTPAKLKVGQSITLP